MRGERFPDAAAIGLDCATDRFPALLRKVHSVNVSITRDKALEGDTNCRWILIDSGFRYACTTSVEPELSALGARQLHFYRLEIKGVNLDAERIWVVKASLLLTGLTFAFFVAAPGLLKYPLDFDQSIRILQIILPVFIGYLGLATAFVFQNTGSATEVYSNYSLIKLLLRGPIYVYSIGIFAVVSVFWLTNLPGKAPASGMTIDQLAWLVSALVGLLAATTGLIITKIFPTDDAKKRPDITS